MSSCDDADDTPPRLMLRLRLSGPSKSGIMVGGQAVMSGTFDRALTITRPKTGTDSDDIQSKNESDNTNKHAIIGRNLEA